MASVYTHTHRSFYTEELLHTEKLLHTANFYTKHLLHTASFYRKKFLHRGALIVRNDNRNCSSKTGSRRQREKKTIFKHFLKGLLQGKLLAPKLRKSADKSLSQAWCSHSNTIYEIQQLQRRMLLRMQPRRQATLTQPLQCVSQHHVANLHVPTRTWQHQMTTIMRPFQCDPQPQIQEMHRTTHTGTTTRCRTQIASGTTAAAPAARGTFHRRLQPLYTEKCKVSCSGFLPKTKPMQHSCSHYDAFRSIPLQTCTYLGNIRWRQSCSHSNAICSHRFKKRIELPTQEQPLVAEHRSRPEQPQPHPQHEVPFIAGCSHFTRKIQGFVLRLPPQNKAHATFMQPLRCVSQHPVANLHIPMHIANRADNNHAAIPMRSATTDSRNA